MSFLHNLADWLHGAAKAADTPRRRQRRPGYRLRPGLEQLESRELLTGVTVAILGSPASGHSAEGTTIYLTSALKGATPGIAYGYSWQVLKNNVTFATTSGSTLAFTPNDDAVYQITLTVWNKNGGPATVSNTIIVDDVAPTVYMSRSFSGTALIALPFHAGATSPGSVDRAAGFTYTWTFGDGTMGNGASPAHTYAKPGKYAVTLSVSDAGGGLETTVAATAAITAPPAPAVGITGLPAYGYSPEGTTLTLGSRLSGTTLGATYAYVWSVFKGTTAYASSTASSISFTPDDAAYYRVFLTVTDQFGTAVHRSVGLIAYDRPPTVQLQPKFVAYLGTAINFAVTIADPGPLDMAAGFKYLWYFGDGTTSHDATPNHTYAKRGVYPVQVIVANVDGLSAAASTWAIVSAPVSAHFIGPVSVGAGTTTAQVKFTNQTGGYGGYTYSYDFGNTGTFEIDGSTSPTATIPESYVDSGPATLTVHGRITDGTGGYADYTTTIHITDVPPTPSITFAPTVPPTTSITFAPTVDAGEAVTFHASATDPSTAMTRAGFGYSWNFGDGSAPVAGASPNHTYAKPGRYTVMLTATDANGGSGSSSITFTANPPPSAIFGGPTSVGAGTTTAHVSFTHQTGGTGGYTYSYDFGNTGTFEIVGSASATALIPEAYVDSGPAMLAVHGRITDRAGGYADYTTTIQITDVPPTPSITFTPTTPTITFTPTVYAGQALTFQASATDPSTAMTRAGFTYSWNFGDGSTPVAGARPSHTYANAGTYTITLTATDQAGDTGARSITFTVSPLRTAA